MMKTLGARRRRAFNVACGVGIYYFVRGTLLLCPVRRQIGFRLVSANLKVASANLAPTSFIQANFTVSSRIGSGCPSCG